MRHPFALLRAFVLGVLLLGLGAAPSALAQTGSVTSNLHIADTKAKDPAVVAANHLAKANRALARAHSLEEKAAAEPDAGKAAKLEKKAEKAFRQAEREAGMALSGDAGLLDAYFVRGRARLQQGEGPGARSDCLQAMNHDETGAALDCYARANLLIGEGSQALSIYNRMREQDYPPHLAESLLTEIRAWIEANPDGEKEQSAARWLEAHGAGR